ncbi:hypothetical protein NERG_02686 [Nematocida ausubeli]|uniref:Uncharacterized protein n=1 Tax=Nematocida ausubeli (strain ATCC PRA-371 / ERTm2) TaxID=1913371 RepID=H8ZGG5_NEMA1|nr:hypothetical protein NERG_02686 [Nematocida ausubeli]
MASTKKWSKESIKEYVIIAAAVLLILSMVLCTCVSTPLSQDKSQKRPLSMIDESGTSSKDPKNSAVHENKEPGEEKSKEVEGKAGTGIHIEQVDAAINMRGTCAPLGTYAPDKLSNSSSTKKEKGVYDSMYKAQHAVKIGEKEHIEKKDTLEEMKAAANAAFQVFCEKDKILVDAEDKYKQINDKYKLADIASCRIKNKISSYYNNPENTDLKMPTRNSKNDSKIDEINLLFEEINNGNSDRKIKEKIYEEALEYKEKLEQNRHRSREDTLIYHSHVIELARQLLGVLDCVLVISRKKISKYQLLYSIRKDEIKYLKIEEKNTNLHEMLLQLYRECFYSTREEFGLLTDMRRIKSDIILKAVEVHDAYKLYHAAQSKYEI